MISLAHLGRGGEADGTMQNELFESPSFSPRYPPSSSLAGEALQVLLQGRTLTHPEFEAMTASWRLSEPIRALRHDYGWPVVTLEIPAPTPDRPDRTIARYLLPGWVCRKVAEVRHG